MPHSPYFIHIWSWNIPSPPLKELLLLLHLHSTHFPIVVCIAFAGSEVRAQMPNIFSVAGINAFPILSQLFFFSSCAHSNKLSVWRVVWLFSVQNGPIKCCLWQSREQVKAVSNVIRRFILPLSPCLMLPFMCIVTVPNLKVDQFKLNMLKQQSLEPSHNSVSCVSHPLLLLLDYLHIWRKEIC